jgi:hypothetical protein
MPMKRGFDITHGWLKTGFFDIGLRYSPPNRAKNPVFLVLWLKTGFFDIGLRYSPPNRAKNPVSLVLTRKFCSTKRA